MRRRGATGLAGILPIDKPAGMTSHDVVAIVRRETGEGRVGHAGTLDPMATGLLVVMVGPFTRLEPYLSAASKSYDATIVFGAETDTDDAEGEVTRIAPVPTEVREPEFASAALTNVLGESLQMPPAYSAIKVRGVTAHRAARAGLEIELQARPIRVFSAELTRIYEATPSWDVSFVVSKGTYVRALARDLGRACGAAAHLGALRRTASGNLDLGDAHTLRRVEESARAGHFRELFIDPLAALGMPSVEVAGSSSSDGAPLRATGAPGIAQGSLVAVTDAGTLVGVYRAIEDRLLPATVLPKGETA